MPAAEDSHPRPHGQSLAKLLASAKLPTDDHGRVLAAQSRYRQWTAAMAALTETGPERVAALVRLLNEYKLHVDLDTVWDSPNDFIRRQDGQLKLRSTILEEFLPRLCDPAIIPELDDRYVIGPQRTLTAIRLTAAPDPQMVYETKDQDFAITRPVRSQFNALGDRAPVRSTAAQPYVVVEVKTNLDSTMLQGICQVAGLAKTLVDDLRYFVACEWLDMSERRSSQTPVDEVLILRGPRPTANVRAAFSSPVKRAETRDEYVDMLTRYPVREDMVQRLVELIRDRFLVRAEQSAVKRGYF